MNTENDIHELSGEELSQVTGGEGEYGIYVDEFFYPGYSYIKVIIYSTGYLVVNLRKSSGSGIFVKSASDLDDAVHELS